MAFVLDMKLANVEIRLVVIIYSLTNKTGWKEVPEFLAVYLAIPYL